MNRTQNRREENQVAPPEVSVQKGRDRFRDGGDGEEPSEPWAQSQALVPAQQQRVYPLQSWAAVASSSSHTQGIRGDSGPTGASLEA